MTREEAIEKLKNFADHCYPNEEFLTAIKALEQEPKETWSIKDVATTFERHGLMTEQESCEDAISRAELLKAVDTWDKFGCDADTKLVPIKDCYVQYIHYDDVVKAIKGMPSIQTKTDVLDKIRAEIEQTVSRYSISRECGCIGQVEWSDRLIKESEVLQILDKYNAEKE